MPTEKVVRRRRRTCPFWGPLFVVAVVVIFSPTSARAATQVSGTYAQVGARTLSVYTLIDGAPKSARVILETKRFSKARKGRARSTKRKLARSGRMTIKVGAPRGAKLITARLRVVVRQKRRGRKTRQRTVGKGQWKTIAFAQGGRAGTVAKVKPGDLSSLTPPTPAALGSVQLTGTSATTAKAGQVIALGITPTTPDGLLEIGRAHV